MARTVATPPSCFSPHRFHLWSIISDVYQVQNGEHHSFLYKRLCLNNYYADLQKPQPMYASVLSLAVFWYTYKQRGMVFGGRKMRVSLFPFLTLHAWVCTTQLAKMSPEGRRSAQCCVCSDCGNPFLIQFLAHGQKEKRFWNDFLAENCSVSEM